MTAKIWPQPLVVVRDVPASSRFYAQLLGAESAHGGEEYEQLVSGGELILQLHHSTSRITTGRSRRATFPSGTAFCSGSRSRTSTRRCSAHVLSKPASSETCT